MKTNLAVRTDSTTPRVVTEYMAYFSHIENSVVVYRTMPKGGSKTSKGGKISLKLQDLPIGFRLGPVHPVDELKQLTE